jgi:hypothetical protein
MLELVKMFFNHVWQFVFGGLPENLSIMKNKKCDLFEITDNEFRFLARISPEFDTKNYQIFVEGVVRGALCNLGVEPSPTAECKRVPDNTGRQHPAL